MASESRPWQDSPVRTQDALMDWITEALADDYEVVLFEDERPFAMVLAWDEWQAMLDVLREAEAIPPRLQSLYGEKPVSEPAEPL